MVDLNLFDRAMFENNDVLTSVNIQERYIAAKYQFLTNNEIDRTYLIVEFSSKPNVNGTLERTKSAPGEGKSAQNKIEEKKILGVRACAHARGKTDGLSCLLQMRPFAARFARKNPSSGGRLGRKKRENGLKTAAGCGGGFRDPVSWGCAVTL